MEKKTKKTEENYPFLEATGFFFWLAVVSLSLGGIFALGFRIILGL
jgi:hypothetical protein